MKKWLFLIHNTFTPKGIILGPSDQFADFIMTQGYKVHICTNPLDHYDYAQTELSINRKKLYHLPRGNFFGPFQVLNLMLDFILATISVWYCKPDFVVGANNFDTLAGITARFFMFRRPTVVYFATDYVPDRFTSSIMGFIYKIVEKISLRYCDLCISNTSRSATARQTLGLKAQKSLVIPNTIVIPNGSIRKKAFNRKHFIFIGHASAEHGLTRILEAIYPIIESLTLIIYGQDDPKLEKVLGKISRVKILRNKKRGFILSHLRNFSGFGLAPYTDEQSWTFFCSPLKVVEYISSGVPILISDIPEIAERIRDDKLGVVFNWGDTSKLATDIANYSIDSFYKKAPKFRADHDQNFNFSRALSEITQIHK